MEKLTATEKAIAAMVAEGAGNKEIATTLHVSEQRVKNSLQDVYRLLDLPRDHDRRVLLALMVERERDKDREGG